MNRLVEAFIVALAAALGTAAGTALVEKAKKKRTVTCPRCDGEGEVEE